MRILLLMFFVPIALHSQHADTVIDGKRYVLFSSYARADSIIVFEYCRSKTKAGEANGEYRAFAQSGVLMEQGQWCNGKRVGAWFSYFPDGKVEHSGNYKKGWAIGTWIWYHPNGAVKGRTRYIQRKIFRKVKVPSLQQTRFFTPKRYYPWFKVIIEPTAVDSFVEYYANSQVKVRMLLSHKGGERDSTMYYYPSGQLNCVQYWQDGYGDGCWKYYCTDGTLSHCVCNGDTRPETLMTCDENYADCDYYDIVIDVPWLMGQIRAKF